MKPRNHNEYFRPITKKRCDCGERTQVWSWGEYIHGKWHTVKHFCEHCYNREVRERLVEHSDDCGCTISLVGYHCQLPEWLSLEESCNV
jgi:hypothetical protein